MTGPTLIIAFSPFLLVVITCQADDLINSVATSTMNPEKFPLCVNTYETKGTDFRCLQYMCLRPDKPLCRGCFWFSDCLGDKQCVTHWCGDVNFFKELQLSPCCQDFTSIPQDEKEVPLPHRCCMIGEGKRAILVPRLENATSESSFKMNLGDKKQAKCQLLKYGFTEKIRHCQIYAIPTTTTTTTGNPISSPDKKLPSIGGDNTIHQSADLILVVCTSVLTTTFL